MYNIVYQSHHGLRYIVLLLLVAVIIKSLIGILSKKSFTNADNGMSLFLLITTHLQFVLGLVLYFLSPFVRFSSETMKVAEYRYWTVEHIAGMLVAVVLITVGRSLMKKRTDAVAKHKKLFTFNTIALVIIVVILALSGRGIL